MLDHIILTVSDIERSLAFYEAALKPLNIKFFMPYKGKDGHPDLWGFGDTKKAFFWIKQGKPDPTAIHWGFVAENKNKVDEFYQAAISAGATDNISPRTRLEYYPGYYATDVWTPMDTRSRSSIRARGPRLRFTQDFSMARMSRFSKIRASRSALPSTATSTMARARSSAGIT
jgi:catechol 2,3-dioxygenase-like lactoylglutathione lyase family enzyme